MTTAAKTAIARSISHNEIVHIDQDAEAHEELLLASEDSVWSDPETQYWGTTEDGHEWRVHVRGKASADREAVGEEEEATGAVRIIDIRDVRTDADLERISASDLRDEAHTALSEGVECEHARYEVAGIAGLVDVIYLPDARRAGVCSNGNARWTDADSAEGAVTRYLSDRMSP